VTSLGNSAASRDIAHVLHPYTDLKAHQRRGPLIVTHGRGVRVFDDQGRDYIEALAGLWCVSLGFNEARLVDAARRQLERLPYYHSFAHKSHEPAIELAERILALLPTPMSKVFFSNSGSEANDTAIKMVWYYNNARGRPGKEKIVSRILGYHGVTVATASLTGLPNNHRDFDLPIANVLHTACPHHYRFAGVGESEEAFATRLAAELDTLIEREGSDTVAAFIAEPVMGAGGVIVPPEGYFREVMKVCRKYDVYMISDEVICGFGRLGTMFGCTALGFEPHSISVAKALTSAYVPMAAVTVPEAAYQAMLDESRKIGTFGHGFTYSGHPVAAAVALKALDIYARERIAEQVARKAPHFQARLAALGKHPLVGEARGLGLVGGLELVADKTSKRSFEPKAGIGPRVVHYAEEEGLIVRFLMGDVLSICPPLIITPAEIDELFDRLGRALDRTLAWVKHERLMQA